MIARARLRPTEDLDAEQESPLRADLRWAFSQMRPSKLRPIGQWAEEEIIIPDGPHAGKAYSLDRQPYARHYFAAIESGLWNRFAIVGPTQSGKTMTGFVIPVMHHLFEMRETVIAAVPSGEIAADKWREDLLPAIEKSRYKDLLPSRGTGSRGGTPTAIRFRNGATLRWMTGGGGDKKRSAFSARVVAITEVDGMDEPGKTSRETDKIRQILGRTRAYRDRAVSYMECTVTTEDGRIWQEYQGGTASKIVSPCPHCNAWIAPERPDLVGWHESEHERAAMEGACWACPECGQFIDERQRLEANRKSRLVHEGQTIDSKGVVHGDRPPKLTFSLRWNAWHNQFRSAGSIGVLEWKASRRDDENMEKELLQFEHCLPWNPPIEEEGPVDAHALDDRIGTINRGTIPNRNQVFLACIDLGKFWAHWVAYSSMGDFGSHVVDYGVHEIHSDSLNVEVAIQQAMRELDEAFKSGWAGHIPELIGVDSGYSTKAVYRACKELGEKWVPIKGYGTGQRAGTTYSAPKGKNSTVRWLGERCHLVRLREDGVLLFEFDTDYWKSHVHRRLMTPVSSEGAMTVFRASPPEHLKFFKHLTAEHSRTEFKPGVGNVTKWFREKRSNHWFDDMAMAAALTHAAESDSFMRLMQRSWR